MLADTLFSGAAETVFGFQGHLLALDAWAGVLAFSCQMFFHIAGYSTCAIGAAFCLGFALPDNIRYPHAAITCLAVAAREFAARQLGYAPTLADRTELWAEARERVQAESIIIIIGSSRSLFNIDLPTLEQGLGKRPAKLSLVAAAPIPYGRSLRGTEASGALS